MNDYRNSSIPLATVRPREGSARRFRLDPVLAAIVAALKNENHGRS